MLKNLIQSFFWKMWEKGIKEAGRIQNAHFPHLSPALSDLNPACGSILDFVALASCAKENLSAKLSDENDFCNASVEAH